MWSFRFQPIFSRFYCFQTITAKLTYLTSWYLVHKLVFNKYKGSFSRWDWFDKLFQNGVCFQSRFSNFVRLWQVIYCIKLKNCTKYVYAYNNNTDYEFACNMLSHFKMATSIISARFLRFFISDRLTNWNLVYKLITTTTN